MHFSSGLRLDGGGGRGEIPTGDPIKSKFPSSSGYKISENRGIKSDPLRSSPRRLIKKKSPMEYTENTE